MKPVIKTFGLALLLSGTFAAPSLASVFVWQDPETGVSASFPDRWMVVTNQDVNDVLTVRAPGEHAFAGCSISAKTDERFKIYPRRFAENIQRVALTENYWQGHFADTNNPVFHSIEDNKGLGRGFASMATVSYETAPDNLKGPKVYKHGIAFAALYDKTLYTVQCSAEAAAYSQYHNMFLSFIKSVDFDQRTNYALTGYYRNFMDDCILKVRGPTMWDDSYH